MKTKFMAIGSALIIPLLFIVSLQIMGMIHFPAGQKFIYVLSGILGTSLSLMITYFLLKLEKSSFQSIGFVWGSKTLKKTIDGLLLGFLIAGVMIGAIVFFADLKISFIENKNILIPLLWLLVFIPLSFMEEVIFRGLAFIKLNKFLGLRATQIIIALLFAYYHDFTGATFMNQLMGPGIWAIIFGWAAVRSDGIAFPTGIHIAANMLQAVLGMKEDMYAIWNIEYTKEVTPAMQAQTETIGIIIQVSLLVTGIILTEIYLQKKKKSRKNSYYN